MSRLSNQDKALIINAATENQSQLKPLSNFSLCNPKKIGVHNVLKVI